MARRQCGNMDILWQSNAICCVFFRLADHFEGFVTVGDEEIDNCGVVTPCQAEIAYCLPCMQSEHHTIYGFSHLLN